MSSTSLYALFSNTTLYLSKKLFLQFIKRYFGINHISTLDKLLLCLENSLINSILSCKSLVIFSAHYNKVTINFFVTQISSCCLCSSSSTLLVSLKSLMGIYIYYDKHVPLVSMIFLYSRAESFNMRSFV